MSPHEALREAESRGLDLVEISPNAKPPVCKIVDYGKYKYEQKKKNAGQNKKPASSVLKEISLGVQTHDHDIKFKVNHAIRFLKEGHRVKVSIRFRGREMAHPEVGREQMLKFIALLQDYGQVEANPKMEGRFLHALLNPLPAVVKKAAQEKEREKAKREADSTKDEKGSSSQDNPRTTEKAAPAKKAKKA